MTNVTEKKKKNNNKETAVENDLQLDSKQRGRKKGQETVDIGEFVYFWETAESKQQVADHFGMTLQSVTTKANNIRKDYFDGLRTFERKDSGLKDKVLAALAKARGVSIEELLASAKDMGKEDNAGSASNQGE